MNFEMQPLIEALGWSLLHLLWQGAVIAIVLAALLRLLRKHSAQLRYSLASLGLLAMLAAFACTFAKESASAAPARESVTTLQSSAAANEPAAPAATPPEPAAAAAALESHDLPNASAERATVPPQDAPSMLLSAARVRAALPWVVGAWGLGVALLSARMLAGWCWMRRMTVSATPPVRAWRARFSALCEAMRVSGPVRLLVSARAPVPMVVGWIKPVVLLPARVISGLSADQIEAVLAHELAHIRRHDYLVNLLQSAVETLFFFHPAVWWISGVMRQEREHCCDDAAAGRCGGAICYARALAALEELRGLDGAPIAVVGATSGSLLGRVRRLLGIAANRSAGGFSWQPGAAVVLLAASLAFGAHVVKGAEREDAGGDAEKGKVTIATIGGTWKLANGVTLEVHREVVHGADVLTTTFLRWPQDGTAPEKNVAIHVAADAFANREPWAIAWDEGAAEFWIATGALRSFRDADAEQIPKATALKHIDFGDPAQVKETYLTGWPNEGRPSKQCVAALNDHLRVSDNGVKTGLAIHWAVSNPVHRMAASLKVFVSVDKSGETFRVSSGESRPLADLVDVLRAEAAGKQAQWERQMMALPPGQREAVGAGARPTASVFAPPDVPFAVMTRVLDACRDANLGPQAAADPKPASAAAPTVRGVSLAGVPQQHDVTKIAELYEADPDHPGAFRKRPGVFFMSLGQVGPWLYVPANGGRFYLEVRPDPEVVSDTIYGPIQGDACEKLGLAQWLREAVRHPDPGYGRRVARDMIRSGDHSLARAAIDWLDTLEPPSPPEEHNGLITALAQLLAEHPDSPVAEAAGNALRELTALAGQAQAAWDGKRKRLPDEQYRPGEPMSDDLPAISWGQPDASGLRLGVARLAPNPPGAIGDLISFDVLVRNDGSEPVKFAWTPRLDEGLHVTLIDSEGREWPASIVRFSGLLVHNRCRLDPGHVLKLKTNAEFAIVATDENGRAADGGAPRRNSLPIPGPGDYEIRVACTIGINDWSDGEGREIVRPAGEWAGTLEAAAAKLTIAAPR